MLLQDPEVQISRVRPFAEERIPSWDIGGVAVQALESSTSHVVNEQ